MQKAKVFAHVNRGGASTTTANCPVHIVQLSCLYSTAHLFINLHCICIYNWFDPPFDITAIPQSYTVHCIIINIGEELERVHYYYNDTPESE